MAHLGERLRQKRIAADVSLQDISDRTRIGVRYLEALEAGEFKQLPGAIFARSFVRQYAQIVGLDPASLESELQQVFPSEEVLPAVDAQPGPLTAALKSDTLLAANGPVWRRLPLTAISLASALILSSLLYLGYQQLVLHNETREPQPVAQQQPPKASQAKPAPDKPLHSDRPVENTSPAVMPAAASAESAKTETSPGTELQPPPAAPTATVMGLRLVANEESWVSIAANGRSLFEGLMQPREERTVNGVENARLLIGNAGGVDVLTDGRSIGPIGPQGSVRIVLLRPQVAPQILRNLETSPTQVQPPATSDTTAAAVPTRLD